MFNEIDSRLSQFYTISLKGFFGSVLQILCNMFSFEMIVECLVAFEVETRLDADL